MLDFCLTPIGPFVGPVVGLAFEGEVEVLAGVVAEVEGEIEPFVFADGLGADHGVFEDLLAGEDAELPVGVGVMADAELQLCRFSFGDFEMALQSGGFFTAEGVGHDGEFVAEDLVGDGAAEAEVEGLEAGGDFLDFLLMRHGGFAGEGGTGVSLGTACRPTWEIAADHAAGGEFLEFGEFAVDRQLQGMLWKLGNHGFKGEPEHAGDVVVFGILGVL